MPVALIPVPLIFSVSPLPPKKVFSVIVPLSVPVPVGANFSVKLFVLPAGNAMGMVKPVVEKHAPLTLALAIIAVFVP